MLYLYFLPYEMTCLWEGKVLVKPNVQHSWEPERLGQHSLRWVVPVQMLIQDREMQLPSQTSWREGGKPMTDSTCCCCLLVETTVKDECIFSVLCHLWLVGAFSVVGSCLLVCVLPTLSSSLPSWQSYRMQVFCADTLSGVELTALMG